MAKVGRFVSDPKAGAHCQIVLDSNEKIVIHHDKGGFNGGRLTIEVPKLMGLRAERVFACDLDSAEGKAVMGRLTREVRPGSVEATPLGAFVDYLKSAVSVADVKSRCAALSNPS